MAPSTSTESGYPDDYHQQQHYTTTTTKGKWNVCTTGNWDLSKPAAWRLSDPTPPSEIAARFRPGFTYGCKYRRMHVALLADLAATISHLWCVHLQTAMVRTTTLTTTGKLGCIVMVKVSDHVRRSKLFLLLQSVAMTTSLRLSPNASAVKQSSQKLNLPRVELFH